jgi:glycerol-3-phosphate dehydrogenase
MAAIIRDPSSAAERKFDLIVIGGGIHGVMVALEASRRGLRTLLLEKEDFGNHTTFNSLRIIHGGLRYLQKLDIPRFRESIAERTWFLKSFPHLVKPLPCLMPLYGEGLRRPFMLRIALMVNHILSLNRNNGVPAGRSLPAGEVIGCDALKKLFPTVPTENLKGGAIWFDAYMPQSQRLLIEILKLACQNGATALNYLEAERLQQSKGKVNGVEAVDKESGKHYVFKAHTVVNAAGPWCRRLAQIFHKEVPDLFKPSLAWNILLNRTPLCDHALALSSRTNDQQTYFLVPWKGRLLVGTGHAACLDDTPESPAVSTKQMDQFLDGVNRALPGLNAGKDDIAYVLSGFLPVRKPGSTHLTTRGIILHHGDIGGPNGFYSLSGIKFTTARRVAQRLLDRMPAARRNGNPDEAKSGSNGLPSSDLFETPPTFSLTNDDDSIWKEHIKKIVREEAVMHLDDVIFRRSDIWEDPMRAKEIAPAIGVLFDWDESRREREIANLFKLLERKSIYTGERHVER